MSAKILVVVILVIFVFQIIHSNPTPHKLANREQFMQILDGINIYLRREELTIDNYSKIIIISTWKFMDDVQLATNTLKEKTNQLINNAEHEGYDVSECKDIPEVGVKNISVLLKAGIIECSDVSSTLLDKVTEEARLTLDGFGNGAGILVKKYNDCENDVCYETILDEASKLLYDMGMVMDNLQEKFDELHASIQVLPECFDGVGVKEEGLIVEDKVSGCIADKIQG